MPTTVDTTATPSGASEYGSAAPVTVAVPVTTAHESQLLRRGIAVVGLVGIALVHVLDATGKFHETPYLGWAYLALVAGCLLVSGMLIERDDRRAWVGAAVLSASAFVGYALSRTTGLPAANGDIGNWFEPLGLATLFAEVLVFGLALRALSVHGGLDRRRSLETARR